MATHAYWRVFIQSCSANAYGALSEIIMASAPGGSTLLSGGSIVSSGNNSNVEANAIDGNIATYWGGTGINGNLMPTWWGYHFASPVDVVEIRITAGAGLETYHPTLWRLDYSDDGTTWATADVFYSSTWVANVQQTFSVGAYSTPATGHHRFWRINIPTTGVANRAALGEVSMASSYGGANLFGSGTPIAITFENSTRTPAQAVDGNSTTLWANTTTLTLPTWWGYDFKNSPPSVGEVRITQIAGIETYGPTAFSLDYSDDEVSWTTVNSFTPGAWVAGVTQTFDTVTTAVASGLVRETLLAEAGTLRTSALIREVLRSTSTGAGTYIVTDGVVREVLRSAASAAPASHGGSMITVIL